MCGIAGFRGRSPARGSVLTDAMARRGPDGAWVAEHAGWTLAQTRLATVDLTGAVRYPMLSASGELALLFNGEIYDHAAVRRDLERRGCAFRTACDAEVVLHGYEVWGEGVFERLDGMFAVALCDRRTGGLLLARDALGIKPLVHTTGPGPVGFASDAVALVQAGLSAGQHDDDALRAHLALHYVPPPQTGLLDVTQVPPGSLVRIGPDGDRTARRWAPDVLAGPPPTRLVPPEEIEATVRGSVERQLLADVPVGVLLSGGVDSALLLAAATLAGHRPVAFTLGFGGHGDYDEGPLAARTAASLGVRHLRAELRGGFAETVDDVAGAFDAPFADSSAIATLQLARLARTEVTVALSGTGGDELFGGYARYRAHRLLAASRRMPAPVRRGLARMEPPRGAERTSRRAALLARAARMAAHDPADPLAQYLGLVGGLSTPAATAIATHAPSLPAAMRAPLDPANSVQRALGRLDLATYLPGDVLAKEDRATMAAGLESRVPFLGREVVALADRLPDGQRATLRRGKVALRELALQLVPEAAAARSPKRGFAVPLGPLLAGRWRAEAQDVLATADGLVDGRAAAAAFRAGALTPADTWMLATLAAWEGRVALARRTACDEPIVPVASGRAAG